jgi:DNA-directed RNA polymerase specialized sigma24 family protein
MERWSGTLITLAVVACVSSANAQPDTSPGHTVRPTRFEQAPVIDGRIDDAIWTKAARIDRFRQIPSPARRAFVLHHLFGLSFKEVGARLGIKAGAAKIRSSRAASAMRALLRGGRNE